VRPNRNEIAGLRPRFVPINSTAQKNLYSEIISAEKASK
jgi:hypothetical protein